MRIRKLYLEHFGALEDHTVEFRDGLNVIRRDNEDGKSTIALFIRCMLYSLTGRRSGKGMTLRERAIPFDRDTASGYMDIESGGELFRISRVIGRTPKSDTLQITDLSDNTLIRTDKDPGEYFTGFSVSSFTDIFYMDDKEVSSLSDNVSELKERLTNKAYTGDDSVSLDKAIETLGNEMRSISNKGRGKKGILEELIEKRDGLNILIPQIREKNRIRKEDQQSYEKLNNDLVLLKEESEKTEKDLAEIRKAKTSDGYYQYVRLQTKTELLKKDIADKDTGKPVSYFESVLKDIEGLKDIESEIEGKNSEMKQCDAVLSSDPDKDAYLYDEGNLKKLRRIQGKDKYLKILEFLTDFMMLIVLFMSVSGEDQRFYFSLPVISMAFFFLRGIPGIIPYMVSLGLTIYLKGPGSTYSILAILFTLIFTGILTASDNMKKELKSLLESSSFDVSTSEIPEIIKGEDKYRESQTLRKKISDEKELLLSEIEERMDDLKLKKEIIISELSSVTNNKVREDLDIGDLKILAERLMQSQKDSDDRRSELNGLLESNLANSDDPSIYRSLLSGENAAQERSDELKDKIHEIQIRLSEIRNRLMSSDIPDENETQEELLSVEDEIRKYSEKLRVLELAKVNLESVVSELSRDYIPELTERADKIFRSIVSDKERSIRLGPDLDITFEESSVYRRHEYLSRGTRNALWFGLRLALYDILKNGDDLPLVFDESFVHIDDRRYRKVLEHLCSVAEDQQIIILTCHDKTENILKEIDNGLYSIGS